MRGDHQEVRSELHHPGLDLCVENAKAPDAQEKERSDDSEDHSY